MALLEFRELQPRLNLSNDSGTWQFKLPRMGFIKALHLLVEITNGATSCKDEDVYDAIDRLEIVANGHTRLYSLTGQQARLWTHVYNKKRPPYYRSEVNDVVQNAYITVPFTMKPSMNEMYLNLQSYQDLELRLTYSPTIAATGFATGTVNVTVFAEMFADNAAPAFNGTLKITEQVYFTSAASGDENYDLPIGNPYVGLGLYVFESGTEPQSNIDEFKLDVDNGRWVPFEGRFEDLNSFYTDMLGIDPEEMGVAYKSDTDNIETRVGSIGTISIEKEQNLTIGTTDEAHVVISGIAAGLVSLDVLSRDAAATASDAANTTDLPLKWIAKPKFGLGNFLFLPMGWPNNLDMALQSANWGRITARMTQGNAGAEVRLSLAEIIR